MPSGHAISQNMNIYTMYISQDTWVNLKLYPERFQGKLYHILVNSELYEFKVFFELKLM